MATAAKKSKKAEKPGGVTGFVSNSYRSVMDFGEKISVATVNLPYVFLESVGVAEDKTKGIKDFNARFIGGVYKGTDFVATRAANASMAPFRWVGSGVSKLAGDKPKAKKPPKKQAKKAEKKAAPKKAAPKKAPKKAAKAKKEPPKIVAKKPAPVKKAA